LGTDVRADLPVPSILRPYLSKSAPLAGQPANRMRQHGIGFKQAANAFLKCAVPDRMQELANSLTLGIW
jgi:hypothetical protein